MMRGAASQKNPPALFVYKNCSCFAQSSIAKSPKTDFANDVYVVFCFSASSEKAYKLTTHYMQRRDKKLAKNANIADTYMARICTFSLT